MIALLLATMTGNGILEPTVKAHHPDESKIYLGEIAVTAYRDGGNRFVRLEAPVWAVEGVVFAFDSRTPPFPLPDATVTIAGRTPRGAGFKYTAVSGDSGTVAFELQLTESGVYEVSVDAISATGFVYRAHLNTQSGVFFEVPEDGGGSSDIDRSIGKADFPLTRMWAATPQPASASASNVPDGDDGVFEAVLRWIADNPWLAAGIVAAIGLLSYWLGRRSLRPS